MERKTIGIDLGHCETTAAYPRAVGADGISHEVLRLAVQGKDQVISTQIILTYAQMEKLADALRPDYQLLRTLGDIRIGSGLPAYVEDGEKFAYFKVPPSQFDKTIGDKRSQAVGLTHGKVMACFVYALVNNILKYNVGDLSDYDRADVDLLVGCPTTEDWTKEETQRAYAELVQRATQVHAVHIVPESRAAMFSSVESKQQTVSAIEGAVVFDFGSSTADCTYMLLGRRVEEFSWELGASKIEETMMRYAYRKAVEEHGPFTPDEKSLVETADLMRTNKESYYNGSFGQKKGQTVYCDFVDAADGSERGAKVRVDDEFMDEVTNRMSMGILCDSTTEKAGTWRGLCREFFLEAKSRIGSASYTVREDGKEKRVRCPIGTVVLTGGASKMNFVYELCGEAFPDATILREQNPSHTVSNGLGWVAVSDENVERCRQEAREELAANGKCGVDALRASLSDALFGRICAIAEERTRAWAERPEENLTLRTLQEDLREYTSSEKVRAELEQIWREKMERWKTRLSEAMEGAVNRQVKRLYSEEVARGLMIPNDVWEQLQSGSLSASGIDVGKMLDKLDVSGLAAQLAAIALQMIIWAVAAVLAFETFGVSVLVAWVLDKVTESVVKDTDLDKPRKKKVRMDVAGKVGDELKKNKKELLKDFDEDLEEQTADYAGIVDGILTAAFEVVTLKRFYR